MQGVWSMDLCQLHEEKVHSTVDGRCKVYPRWLNSRVIYKGIVKGRQSKGVCHFKIRKRKKKKRKRKVWNTHSLSQALTLTLTVTLSPNHYTMNNFGRPCTQFHLMYTTPLYISQEFNHEFNHLRYTLHPPSTHSTGWYRQGLMTAEWKWLIGGNEKLKNEGNVDQVFIQSMGAKTRKATVQIRVSAGLLYPDG